MEQTTIIVCFYDRYFIRIRGKIKGHCPPPPPPPPLLRVITLAGD